MTDIRESKQKDEEDEKTQSLVFKSTVWVSLGVALIVGIITVWYYGGL